MYIKIVYIKKYGIVYDGDVIVKYNIIIFYKYRFDIVWWYYIVKYGVLWDYKVKYIDYKYLYKGNLYIVEVFGNIYYGYMGVVVGWSVFILIFVVGYV